VIINLDRTAVSDLSAFAAFGERPFATLSLTGCEGVRDVTPLTGMMLQSINLPPGEPVGMEMLRTTKSIVHINGQLKNDFWKTWVEAKAKGKETKK